MYVEGRIVLIPVNAYSETFSLGFSTPLDWGIQGTTMKLWFGAILTVADLWVPCRSTRNRGEKAV